MFVYTENYLKQEQWKAVGNPAAGQQIKYFYKIQLFFNHKLVLNSVEPAPRFI